MRHPLSVTSLLLKRMTISFLSVLAVLTLALTAIVNGQDKSGTVSPQAVKEPINPTNYVSQFTRIIGTDFASFGVGGLRNVGSGNISALGVNGTVTKAYLFWHGETNSSTPANNANVVVNGFSVTGIPIGTANDNGWGYSFSQAYRADITNLVAFNPNRTYILNSFGAVDGYGSRLFNPNGASLIIFYNDSDATNDYDVTLFNGNDSNGASDFDPRACYEL